MIYGILFLIVFIITIFLYVPLDEIKGAALPITLFFTLSFLSYKAFESITLPYNIHHVRTYFEYKQLLDNSTSIPICIEKIDEGVFREGQCLNNIIVTNDKELISVINLLYNTDIEKELYEYNKLQNNLIEK